MTMGRQSTLSAAARRRAQSPVRPVRSVDRSIVGQPNAFPQNGGIQTTAPKHRASHPKMTGRLIPFRDYIPTPENRMQGQHWSAPADRNWRGVNVGCYHGTAPNGKSILCEGQRCKFAPAPERSRSTRTKTAQARPERPLDPVAAYLRSRGYTGRITPMIRTLVLDAIEFDGQCAAMAGVE